MVDAPVFLNFRDPSDADVFEVTRENPLPVVTPATLGLIRGIYWQSPATVITGIVPAAAYADLDGFGTTFHIETPVYWLLTEIDYFDLDDEGLSKRVFIASADFGVTSVDNAALVMPDANLVNVLGAPITVATFGDLNTGQVGGADNINRFLYTPDGLWVQLQATGADNIAAGSLPRIQFKGLY